MTRYYFYQADLYTPEGSVDEVDRCLGSNHGVYAVEDDSTPDVIFDQIVKGLNDDATVQYEANARAMNAEPGPSGLYYVLKQFHRLD
jgi:hypothetical protein